MGELENKYSLVILFLFKIWLNTKFTIFMQTSETGWQRLCSKFLQIREREAVGILFILA